MLINLSPEKTNWRPQDGLPLQNWFNNVKNGPVIDQDHFLVNYVGHPYSGSIYYQTARTSGCGMMDSFLYGAAMSTFYLEFGIEAFFTKPSIEDLIFTPFLGAFLGEWAYQKRKEIIANGRRFHESELLGKVILFCLDPIDECYHYIYRDSDK
ncbi:DUF3943 domain-containing protein [Chlamydiia bacterium]|nr:DUF3943 domain-containing protein [Chlamydiia bacterium]